MLSLKEGKLSQAVGKDIKNQKFRKNLQPVYERMKKQEFWRKRYGNFNFRKYKKKKNIWRVKDKNCFKKPEI